MRRRRGDSTKKDFREIGCEDERCMEFFQNYVQVVNIGISSVEPAGFAARELVS
jgi:hypothetical protein